MLNDAACFKRVYIVCGYTDLRSGIDTQASIVDAKTNNSPYVPDTLYLFCGRKSDRIKGLVWEKDGFFLLYKRLEQEFQRMGLNIDRADMAYWTILCAERYLSIFYDYLHQKLYDYHMLQADGTPVLASKENRTDGNRHYMWVYRTGKMYADRQIVLYVLYDYQPSRNASHPRAFWKMENCQWITTPQNNPFVLSVLERKTGL